MTADLSSYANEHCTIPDDENASFIVGFMPFADEHFLLVWSTPKLIDVQRASSLLATDATYKLNW